MAKVSKTEVFDVAIEDFYNVIIDYASYPDFVDGVDDVDVLEQDDDGARVKYSLNLIKEFTYIMKLKHEKPNRVSWELESGDLFKKSSGSWNMTDLGNGKVEVEYSIDVELKVFAPKMIMKKLVSSNLPKMMKSYAIKAQG